VLPVTRLKYARPQFQIRLNHNGRTAGRPTDRHPRFLLFKLTRAPAGEWERALMTVCFVGIAPSRRFARRKSGLKIAQIVAESAAACLLCFSVTEPFSQKE